MKPKDKIYDRLSDDLPINSVVTEAIVDDPLEKGAKLKVLRSIRDDPLAGMLSRDQIDRAMFEAGRRWQRHHEHAEIGGARAIDPTKEAVDGGRAPEPLSTRQMEASHELRRARTELGFQGEFIIRKILGERLSVQEMAMSIGMTTAREFDYISRRFRECLDTLARLWGFA